MDATYWDGVTDYTKAGGDEEKERQEEEERHDEFGNWLESQEDLPPELRLPRNCSKRERSHTYGKGMMHGFGRLCRCRYRLSCIDWVLLLHQ
jgi:hypothetical protein